MKTKLKIENPDSIEMTLTITMPLVKWKLLNNQLDTAYPSWELSNAIKYMVHKATAEFEPDNDDA